MYKRVQKANIAAVEIPMWEVSQVVTHVLSYTYFMHQIENHDQTHAYLDRDLISMICSVFSNLFGSQI